MWCTSCQQDVPGLASRETGDYSCPRCGTILWPAGTHATPEAASDNLASDGAANDDAARPTADAPHEAEPVVFFPDPPPTYDEWELEEKLRHIERLLRIDKPAPSRQGASRQRIARVDTPHAGSADWHQPAATRAKAARSRARWSERWLPLLTWSVLAVGLMASAFGGVLLAWAAAAGRHELWGIGMPVGLAGQIVLVIGLILQLDRLWHDNRDTAEKLDHVGERLFDLNKRATLLGTGSGSASFYSHMAGGASPQLLLADLKSQLDLLSARLGREDG